MTRKTIRNQRVTRILICTFIDLRKKKISAQREKYIVKKYIFCEKFKFREKLTFREKRIFREKVHYK
jgi:hypothetical protein